MTLFAFRHMLPSSISPGRCKRSLPTPFVFVRQAISPGPLKRISL